MCFIFCNLLTAHNNNNNEIKYFSLARNRFSLYFVFSLCLVPERRACTIIVLILTKRLIEIMAILRFYSTDAFHSSRLNQVLNALQEVNKNVFELKTELCYHVEVNGPFSEEKITVLQWILKEPQQVKPLARTSIWESTVTTGKEFIIEIGPRFVFVIPLTFYIIN